VNVSVPFLFPDAVGAKTMVRVRIYPWARVSEPLKPLRVKPAPAYRRLGKGDARSARVGQSHILRLIAADLYAFETDPRRVVR